MLDLKITGGTLVDGTGGEPFTADIGVRDGRIVEIGSLTEAAQSLGAGWGTILFRVIFPNLRVAILSSAFLTMATVIGEYTIASFLVGIKAFGPYMSMIGQNKTYESSSLAIISFLLTWAFMGLIQVFNRGKTDGSSMAGAR